MLKEETQNKNEINVINVIVRELKNILEDLQSLIIAIEDHERGLEENEKSN